MNNFIKNILNILNIGGQCISYLILGTILGLILVFGLNKIMQIISIFESDLN